MILAMADLETPLLKKRWISDSLPESFDFPNEPLGLPIIFPFALAAANPSFVRSEIKINLAIWRRLLVRIDSTIADLHYIIQIAMDWTDYHLHQFTIRGKRYGIPRIPGPSFVDNPHEVQLGDFCFRAHEWFLYEYDFRDSWQHEIRVEKQLPLNPKKTYPLCISGARLAPPEECGGPWRFMKLRQHYSIEYMSEVLLRIFDADNISEYREQYREEISKFQYWLSYEQFSRHEVNVRLKQYILGDPAWQKGEVILI